MTNVHRENSNRWETARVNMLQTHEQLKSKLSDLGKNDSQKQKEFET